MGILIFLVVFACLGAYIWYDHRSNARSEMSKLDAAVKAEAERIRKQIP